jgi:hypothetical protein
MRSLGSVATLLVDPIDQTVEVTDSGTTAVLRAGKRVRIESIGGFEFDVEELFAR